ncbi:glycosyltransferase family 4 protein [Natrialba aegyptia]|uniref:Group 1 glycosyl transferase n=1 Tax=Natrialba aegyptia DSM 13077 TaxID=1227491 RepID=M0AZF2_9EURY|nr:glycosyltransferase family 4 protein [Natrialba aegyptia]ELZ03353.1 group 1 glycosyl transferase [Natrialba aegyptia DSM 13077]
MRILRVAQKVYPDVKGGGPYHVHAMSRDQAAMGHDVTVLTVRYDDSLPHVEERDGYTVVRYDPAVTLLGNDISPGLAQYLSAAEDFDVLHAHSHLYFSTNLAALKRFLGDIPLAITNHGLYSQNAPEWVFDLYLRSIGRWTFNRADVVFCYTDTDKERVREFGVSSRIEVVSNGIDTERFTPNGSESELIESDGPVVLFVGRLVEGKRPTVALEAFAAVAEELPDATLYFCGEGTLKDELVTRSVELGIEDAVTFLGQLPYDEMPTVYRDADLFVLSSRAEGVPRTIMESLSAGVPVVCSELPQVRSAFGDTIAYESIDTVDAFGAQILELLKQSPDPELDSQFRWEQTVDETTAALERIAHS